jgi:hypothetical protein
MLAFIGLVRPGDKPTLVELLKLPDHQGRLRIALVRALEKLFGEPLGDDLWAAAAAE